MAPITDKDLTFNHRSPDRLLSPVITFILLHTTSNSIHANPIYHHSISKVVFLLVIFHLSVHSGDVSKSLQLSSFDFNNNNNDLLTECGNWLLHPSRILSVDLCRPIACLPTSPFPISQFRDRDRVRVRVRVRVRERVSGKVTG